jgi:hypothetical protein
MSIGLYASAALSAGIALVALALVLSARRHLRHSFAVGLLGLVTLAGSSTWMTLASTIVPISNKQPKPPEVHRPAPDPMVADLESRLRAAAELRTIVERDRDAARQDAAQLRKELRLLSERLHREHEALQGRLAEEREQRARSEASVREREAEIALLKRPVSPPAVATGEKTPPPPKPRTPETPSADSLRRVLASAEYSVHPLDHPELVAGMRGRWYSVRLGSKLTFSDRTFGIPAHEENLRKTAAIFQTEVINALGAKRNEVRFFARGSADERRLSRPADQPSVNVYSALPRATGDTFYAKSEPRRVTVVDNRDLPNLRALWLVDTLRPVLGEIAVLDSEPQGREKSAELVMFVPNPPP